ncbi:MAG: glycosyltransferase family 39 protein, partial [Chloroflexaceae bacterium]|nr:glycosyltransferase family 39 protein [Chloroflexaceae bacterium]
SSQPIAQLQTTTRALAWLGALLLACLPFWAAFQAERRQGLHVGDYGDWAVLRGWYDPEMIGGTMGRWSGPGSTLHFAPPGPGPVLLRLRLAAPGLANLPQPVQLSPTASRPLTLSVGPEPRRYLLLLPARSAIGPLELEVAGSLQTPPGDPRSLGVFLSDNVSLTRFAAFHMPLAPLLAMLLSGLAVQGLALLLVSRRSLLVWLAGPLALLLAGLLGLVLPPDQRSLLLPLSFGLPLVAGAALLLAGGLRWRYGSQVALAGTSLALALALGGAMRWYNLHWDGGYVFHPDEWNFNQSARQLAPPYHPRFFAYGSLPLYMFHFTAVALSWGGDGRWLESLADFVLISRAFSALASTLTIALVALMGWHLGRSAGLWAAWLLSGAVLAIQHAHFGTTDSLLTLQMALIAYTSLRYSETGARRWLVAVAICQGVAIATKMTALLFGVFPLLALLVWASRSTSTWPAFLRHMLGRSAAGSAVGLTACLVCAPYYLLDWQGLARSMGAEFSIASTGQVTYTYQFIGSLPYLHNLYNSLFNLGPALLLLGLVAWGTMLWRAIARRDHAACLLTLGAGLYALLVGMFQAKYIRYMLPLLPFTCLFAGLLLADLLRAGGWRRWLGGAAGLATVGLTLAYGLVFVLGVYARPDPRIAASWWMYQQLPQQSIVLREQFSPRLPVAMQEPANPLAERFGPFLFRSETLLLYNEGTAESPAYYGQALSQADYFVIADRSQYATFPRFPELFPVRACFYRQLFSGGLGYQLVYQGSRGPMLGNWRIGGERDPLLEETFQVFDHPTVMIFQRTATATAPTITQALTTAACRQAARSPP